MKRKKFTDQEKQKLLKSKAILKVDASNLTYCSRFKIKAVKEYQNGKSPFQIFLEAEINLDILGRKNAKRSLYRWRKLFEEKGEKALLDETRGKGINGGRPRIKSLSLEEENRRLKAKNALLEAENEFLKKLDLIERGLM